MEAAGLEISDLAYDPLLEPARRGARRRLAAAVGGRVYLGEGSWTPEVAVASYLTARLIVGRISDPYLGRLFGEHEGKRFYALASDEDPDVLSSLADDLEVDSERDGLLWGVALADYLPLARRISGSRWRLVNADVRRGRVWVRRRGFVRILQEAVRDRTSEAPDPGPLPPPLDEAAADVAAMLRERSARARRKSGAPGGFPPCVVDLLDRVRRGENLSHLERFTLAAYLLRVGWSEGEVIDLFRASPDFNERVASYQVRHIASKGYSPPGCERLREWGICRADCGLRSPLQFGRRARKVEGR